MTFICLCGAEAADKVGGDYVCSDCRPKPGRVPIAYKVWAEIEAVYGDEEGNEADYEDVSGWPALVGTYSSLREATLALGKLDTMNPDDYQVPPLLKEPSP